MRTFVASAAVGVVAAVASAVLVGWSSPAAADVAVRYAEVVQVPGEGEGGDGEVTTRGGTGDPPIVPFVASGIVAVVVVVLVLVLRTRRNADAPPAEPTEPTEPT